MIESGSVDVDELGQDFGLCFNVTDHTTLLHVPSVFLKPLLADIDIWRTVAQHDTGEREYLDLLECRYLGIQVRLAIAQRKAGRAPYAGRASPPRCRSDGKQARSPGRSVPVGQVLSTDNPRARLFELGADTLSDAELIEALIQNGSAKARAAAWEIVDDAGLAGLLSATPADLQDLSITKAKAGVLLAAVELARRPAPRSQLPIRCCAAPRPGHEVHHRGRMEATMTRTQDLDIASRLQIIRGQLKALAALGEPYDHAAAQVWNSARVSFHGALKVQRLTLNDAPSTYRQTLTLGPRECMAEDYEDEKADLEAERRLDRQLCWDADDGGPGQDYASAYNDLCDPW